MMMMMMMKEECEEAEIEDESPKVRRLGEEKDDVAIIIDSGGDAALFSLNMADPATGCAGESYPHRGAKSVGISLRDIDGHEVLLKTMWSSVQSEPVHTLLWKTDGAWLGNNGREQILENGTLKVPLNLQNRSLTKMKAASRRSA